jgi:hypothetical protein
MPCCIKRRVRCWHSTEGMSGKDKMDEDSMFDVFRISNPELGGLHIWKNGRGPRRILKKPVQESSRGEISPSKQCPASTRRRLEWWSSPTEAAYWSSRASSNGDLQGLARCRSVCHSHRPHSALDRKTLDEFYYKQFPTLRHAAWIETGRTILRNKEFRPTKRSHLEGHKQRSVFDENSTRGGWIVSFH